MRGLVRTPLAAVAGRTLGGVVTLAAAAAFKIANNTNTGMRIDSCGRCIYRGYTIHDDARYGYCYSTALQDNVQIDNYDEEVSRNPDIGVPSRNSVNGTGYLYGCAEENYADGFGGWYFLNPENYETAFYIHSVYRTEVPVDISAYKTKWVEDRAAAGLLNVDECGVLQWRPEWVDDMCSHYVGGRIRNPRPVYELGGGFHYRVSQNGAVEFCDENHVVHSITAANWGEIRAHIFPEPGAISADEDGMVHYFENCKFDSTGWSYAGATQVALSASQGSPAGTFQHPSMGHDLVANLDAYYAAHPEVDNCGYFERNGQTLAVDAAGYWTRIADGISKNFRALNLEQIPQVTIGELQRDDISECGRFAECDGSQKQLNQRGCWSALRDASIEYCVDEYVLDQLVAFRVADIDDCGRYTDCSGVSQNATVDMALRTISIVDAWGASHNVNDRRGSLLDGAAADEHGFVTTCDQDGNVNARFQVDLSDGSYTHYLGHTLRADLSAYNDRLEEERRRAEERLEEERRREEERKATETSRSSYTSGSCGFVGLGFYELPSDLDTVGISDVSSSDFEVCRQRCCELGHHCQSLFVDDDSSECFPYPNIPVGFGFTNARGGQPGSGAFSPQRSSGYTKFLFYKSSIAVGRLKECEGDCSRDADCETGLRCDQGRGSGSQSSPLNFHAPGCYGLNGSTTQDLEGQSANRDYCYDPYKKGHLTGNILYDGYPLESEVQIGDRNGEFGDNDGTECTDTQKCTKCRGDCDRDSQCAPNLKCATERGVNQGYPPGCKNEYGMEPSLQRKWDYCYDPNDVPKGTTGEANLLPCREDGAYCTADEPYCTRSSEGEDWDCKRIANQSDLDLTGGPLNFKPLASLQI